jgi:hypothetical protein
MSIIFEFNKGIGNVSDKITCNKCGWSWYKKDGGRDYNTCHRCGNANSAEGINGVRLKGKRAELWEKMQPYLGKKRLLNRDVERFYRNSPSSQANLIGEGEDNPKLSKNVRKSYIMYLAPDTYGGLKSESGKLYNTCPNASPQCRATCLNLSGNPVSLSGKVLSRSEKTAVFFGDREYFLLKLALEIYTIAEKPKNQGSQIAIRLNGTSDLPFIQLMNKKGYLDELPKNIVFYDYTKSPKPLSLNNQGWGFINLNNKSKNPYIVTFSRSEINSSTAKQVLASGGLVAIPFSNWSGMKERSADKIYKGTGKSKEWTGKYKNSEYPLLGRYDLPKTWYGFPVVNGDKKDDYMLDLYFGLEPIKPTRGKGIVLGLHVKNIVDPKTKKVFKVSQTAGSGFIVKCDSSNCRVG